MQAVLYVPLPVNPCHAHCVNTLYQRLQARLPYELTLKTVACTHAEDLHQLLSRQQPSVFMPTHHLAWAWPLALQAGCLVVSNSPYTPSSSQSPLNTLVQEESSLFSSVLTAS
jgi:hypothetical protein